MQALFNGTCTGCHGGSYPSLTDVNTLVDMEMASQQSDLPLVAPGDRGGSYLYKLLGLTVRRLPMGLVLKYQGSARPLRQKP